MTIEEAQNKFVDLLKEKGITTPRETLFFDNKSKRLTSTGNIYASMLKISNEINTYTLNIPLSLETKQILESNLNSFYYVDLNKRYINQDSEQIKITIYEENFDIKIQLLGGIDQWWNKIKGEYYA